VLGRVAHAVAVRSALGAIFDYRFARIRDFFPRAGDAALRRST
jgi:hypothetical protein